MGHSKETLDRLRREQIARSKSSGPNGCGSREEEQQKILADRRPPKRLPAPNWKSYNSPVPASGV